MGLMKFLRAWACAAVALSAVAPRSVAAEPAPKFDLPRRGVEGRVRLEDFTGQIVVLDFFAYWCAPCLKASRELESGVQQFYGARQGNPHRVPVRVVSVNIEAQQPARTERFIRDTGASFVADDPAATLLKQFGAANIPFLVVIDGTASRPDAPRFEVVYRRAGFEGVDVLRGIIDGLGAAPGEKTVEQSAKGANGKQRLADALREQTFEVDSEVAWASDMLLSESTIRYRQSLGGKEWDLSVSYATFDEDYRPNPLVDANPFEEHLHEDRIGGQLQMRLPLAERLTFLSSIGLYEGYLNYRRVWIANRYRQKYGHPDFPRVPGYEPPDPKGANVSLGTRWEYLPATGFAEWTLGYARDKTAPGYEDGEDAQGNYKLLQGQELLDTWSVKFSSENVLTRRLRALNEFSFAWTTERDMRFTYQGSLNLALGERWVLRGYGGITTEDPQFDAHFFGATLECEVLPGLLLGATGRYYEDTGEIESGLPFTSAAPPLRSWEAGVSLRYSWRRATLKASFAPFATDYKRDPLIGPEFFYLYEDRRWSLAQIALSVQF